MVPKVLEHGKIKMAAKFFSVQMDIGLTWYQIHAEGIEKVPNFA